MSGTYLLDYLRNDLMKFSNLIFQFHFLFFVKMILKRNYVFFSQRKLVTAAPLVNKEIGQVIKNIVENVEDLYQF